VTAELPMLALILQSEATPMHIGSSSGCWMLAGMIMRAGELVAHQFGRDLFAVRDVGLSSVMSPLRASCIWEKLPSWFSALRRASHSARGFVTVSLLPLELNRFAGVPFVGVMDCPTSLGF